MNSLLTGVGILALLFVWKYVWQRTLLDTTRDKLFDLRDGAREWFIDNGYSLDNSVYLALREVLNCHLRNTEGVSMISFFSYLVTKNRYGDYDKVLGERISNCFATDDEKISQYITKIRWQAGTILLVHMIKKSIFLSICALALTLLLLIRSAFICVLQAIKNKDALRTAYKMATAGALMAFFSVLSPGQSSNIRMEKFSVTQVASQSGGGFPSRCTPHSCKVS